jgi:RNA polymerase primary sigma factor
MSKTDGDRVIDAYFSDMRGNSFVPQREEQELVKAYRTCSPCGSTYALGSSATRCPRCSAPRNFKARDRLISGALRFVVKVAKEYAFRTRGPNFENDVLTTLISAGNVGLLVAADRFDSTRNTKFLTYAAWWVREKILEELDSQGIIRVPAHKQKALRAQRKYGGGHDVETPHVTLDSVEAIDDAGHGDASLERDLMNAYGLTMLRQALAELSLRERDKYIVLAYFGSREEPKNLRQISKRVDLSSERVRQIKKDTMEQLKTHLMSKQVGGAQDVFSEI